MKQDSRIEQKNEGFTLIELIVTITIIALITVVAMVSFGGINKKSRDGRRMGDLEKYRIALEMARQLGTTYPSSLETLVTMNLMGEVVRDPKTGADYDYDRLTNYTYVLSATMEDVGSTNAPGMVYEVRNP